MPLWNRTDREESKPTWLNVAQKVNCVRTVKGWELPLDGTSLGGQLAGKAGPTGTGMGGTASVPFLELLVAMPFDQVRDNNSVTGTTSAFYAARDGATGGLTFDNDTPNYRPFFTCPFSGDSGTAGASAGGLYAYGLSFANQAIGSGAAYGSYAVNAFGVSTLHFLGGQTAYIKVVANDTNFTQNLSFSEVADQFGAAGNIISGAANLVDPTKVPTAIYEAFFGPTNDYANNISVFKINKPGATANSGPRTVTLRVTDNSADGLTADTTFYVSFGTTA